jgi:hypothetical protein
VAAEGKQGGRKEAADRHQGSPEVAPAVAEACSLAVEGLVDRHKVAAAAAAAVVGCLGLAMKVGPGLVVRLEEGAEAVLVAVLQVDKTGETCTHREAAFMYTCSENRPSRFNFHTVCAGLQHQTGRTYNDTVCQHALHSSEAT